MPRQRDYTGEPAAQSLHLKVRPFDLASGIDHRHLALAPAGAAGADQPTGYLFLLASGRAEVIGGGERRDGEAGEPRLRLEGPAAGWIEAGPGDVFRLAAGASARLLGVSADLLAEAVGEVPESLYLRLVTRADLAIPLGRDAKALAALAAPLDFARRELAEEAAGARLALATALRMALIQLWRLSGLGGGAAAGPGGPGGAERAASATLQRFRQLLEMNFRRHWPVAAYCEAIGVSHDRLLRLCRRRLAKTPLELIHERLIHEAIQLLERTDLTVAGISDALGFRDPAHFSQLFRSRLGRRPGAFRAYAKRHEGSQVLARERSYADWP